MTDPARAARVVADADVLAADLLRDGPAREALDRVREHSWVDLVASDPLLADAEALVAELADPDLAADWRARVEADRVRVKHGDGDHPALGSAVAGDAAHLLTLDEGLAGVGANRSVRRYRVSVRTPAAFLTVFDPAALYPTVVGGDYPGPDQDPRG